MPSSSHPLRPGSPLRLCLVGLLALFTTAVFSHVPLINGLTVIPSYSVFTLVVLVALWVLYDSAWKRADRRGAVYSFLAGLILALAQKIGADFINAATNKVSPSLVGLVLGVIALTLFFQALLIILFALLTDRLDGQAPTGAADSPPKPLARPAVSRFLNTRWPVLSAIIGLLFLAWLPAFLAVFPGNLSYDGIPQIQQMYPRMDLYAHHPVVHTLMLDGLLGLGHLLTGDYNTGLMLYTLVQMALCASCFGYVLYRLLKLGHSKALVLIGLIFLAANPIVQIWVVTTTKDVPFAAFFVVTVYFIYEFLLDPAAFLKRPGRIAALIICGILMCLLRNQGIYVFAVTAVFVIIKSKRLRLKALALCLAVIIPSWLFLGPLQGPLGIKPGDSREAYSVPIQQLARVFRYNPASVTPEQREIIEKVIPQAYLDQYIELVSDPVKGGFDTAAFNKEKAAFLKAWLEIGLKNKRLYAESFLWGSVGYFYTDYSPYWIEYILYDGAHLSGPEAYLNILHIKRETKFPAYDRYLRSVSKDLSLNNIPVVAPLTNEAAPFWAFVVCAAYALYRRRKAVLIAILPVLLFWGTNLLGPVVAVRYAFPIIVLMPFMLITVSALVVWPVGDAAREDGQDQARQAA